LRRRVILVAVAALIVILGIFAFVLSRQRLRRHRYFRAAPAEQAKPAGRLGASEHWTDQFRAFETLGKWGELAKILDDLARSNPDLYNRYQLGYLHARALIEHDQSPEAMRKLAPFLANGNRFRDLALFHRAEIDETRNEHEAASRARQMLIFEYPKALYRDQAIDDETEYLTRLGDPQALSAFGARIYPSASTARRRDLDAHLVEVLVRRGDAAGALQKGIALLRAGTMDDPADLVSRALDRPELIRRMTPDQQAMLGEAFQNHRHFDRAVALLSMAIRAMPQKHDELQFGIGRCYFGDEKYPRAQQAYMAGATTTRDPRWKATFLFHASRAAQLQGDDAASERLMTGAIAVPGRFPATTAALTQRMRTRLKQRRFAEAGSDLAFIRKNWPHDHAIVEASIATRSECWAPATVARQSSH
jgi:tetratricopeptide (TPR) repeat protein